MEDRKMRMVYLSVDFAGAWAVVTDFTNEELQEIVTMLDEDMEENIESNLAEILESFPNYNTFVKLGMISYPIFAELHTKILVYSGCINFEIEKE